MAYFFSVLISSTLAEDENRFTAYYLLPGALLGDCNFLQLLPIR